MADSAPPAPSDGVAAWRAAISHLPHQSRRALAHMFTPSALEDARHAQRDAQIVAMVTGREGSALALARQLHIELTRYAAGPWRFEKDLDAPRDPRHRSAHAVLRIDGGKIITVRHLRRILSGEKLATKTAGNGQRTALPCPHGKTSRPLSNPGLSRNRVALRAVPE